MPILAKDKQELEQLHSDYRQYGGHVNDYFAFLFLRRRFKVEPPEARHQVAVGNNDYGLDAYYVDTQARNLYLYQFKWSESAEQFKGSMERLARDGMTRVFGNPKQDAEQNEFLRYLKRDLVEYRDLIQRVYVQFVFKGDVEVAERSEGLQARKEDIENKQHLVDGFFGRDMELRVDFIADRPSVAPPPGPQTYAVQLSDAVEVQHGEHRMLVGFVKLHELYNIYVALGQRFFDRNIRASLSPDLPPNRRIRQALADAVLKGTDDPALFTFRHNGVTLAAERVTRKDGTITLHVPRLLNGAQTVSSLAKFLGDNADHPGLVAGRGRLESIAVLAKIIEADPASDFVVDVTIATNRQNPVQPWTLRAMDRRQVDLADKFREEVGIFYSRQEGAFANLSDEERTELGIDDPRDIRIRQLAQTLLAAQGEIDKMSRLPEVFENQALYDSTFKDKYVGHSTDIRDVVLAYKVGLVLNSPMATLRENLPQKHYIAIGRAKNLVWALLIQAVLNDTGLARLREDYGTTLAKEFAFREKLQSLAKKNVRPILKDIFGHPAYQDRLAQEKYEFLRTKECHKRAMDVAWERFHWKKKQL
jgi:hypothetical protein